VAGLGLSLADDKIDWLLTNNHDLLILHLIMLVISVQSSLHVVLHLGLWLLA
jgi:hypothetical protein